jgi:hypothetical protein
MSRFADGEALPQEALIIGQHLPSCTACRILLFRERRLKELLERELPDRLPVGEEFVDAVMAALPQDPPPRTPQRSRRLRGIRLASWAGAALLLPLGAVSRGRLPQATPALPTWPPGDLSLVDATAGAVNRLAAVALKGLPSAPGWESTAWGLTATASLGALVLLVVACLGLWATLSLAGLATERDG